MVHDIDPQMLAAIEINRAAGGRDRPVADTPVPELRRLYAAERAGWNAERPEVAEVRDDSVEGPAGPVPVRLYHPRPGTTLTALLYFHGGGWVVGSNDTHDRIMRLLALKSGRAVLGVDYRLAPEAKFPVQIDEALAACRALRARASDWGLAAEAPVLSGDSAGAQIALAAALSLRDVGDVMPGGLALFYGVYGLRDSRARRVFDGSRYGLSGRDIDFYWSQYVRDAADLADPRLDLLSAELAGLPPAFLGVAALDPLLDDNLAMAERLRAAGVPAELRVYPGMLHGFLHYSKLVARAMQALDEAAAWVAALP
jgi:acetyl esterase